MDFVTFDIAKKLKKKGFKLACIGHYEGDRFEYNTYDGYDINISYIARSYNDDDRFVEYTDVPVICQVLMWLREKKKLHVSIMTSMFKAGWCYEVIRIGDSHALVAAHSNSYNTYEEAAIAGIEYVVDNLI